MCLTYGFTQEPPGASIVSFVVQQLLVYCSLSFLFQLLLPVLTNSHKKPVFTAVSCFALCCSQVACSFCCLVFQTSVHFQLIFIWCDIEVSFHLNVDIQFLQYHLFKTLSFPHCTVSESLPSPPPKLIFYTSLGFTLFHGDRQFGFLFFVLFFYACTL